MLLGGKEVDGRVPCSMVIEHYGSDKNALCKKEVVSLVDSTLY